MGVRIIYWAIPPQSGLYRSLQEDVALNTLMSFLISYGRELYQPSVSSMSDMQESIASLLEYNPSALGSKPAQSVNSFFSILEKTCADYPSIEKRVVALEKCSLAIETNLQQALEKKRPGTATKMVSKIMWGDGILHPNWRRPGQNPPVGESALGLISPSIVKEGASVMAQWSSQQLFPNVSSQDSWHQDQYQRWQRVYLAAAGREEAFILGVS
ncbi:MAG: hypothetical protein ACFB0D_08405 [Phormidesmis sp.]